MVRLETSAATISELRTEVHRLQREHEATKPLLRALGAVPRNIILGRKQMDGDKEWLTEVLARAAYVKEVRGDE